MSKTITMRIDDNTYDMFKKAAQGSRRNISNFLEFAAISYLSQVTYASDDEMKDLLKDHDLLKSLQQGDKEIKEGKYSVVE